MERDETIKAIRDGLRKRSGKPWSVTGGRGTAWGWLNIQAPPKRCTWRQRETGLTDPDTGREGWEWYDTGAPGAYMSPRECEELGKLLGLEKPVHFQGESIPSGGDYWAEYVDRAEGRKPTKCGVQYWD